MSRAIPILPSIFNRFVIDFRAIFQSLKLHFLINLYWFYNLFLLLRLFHIILIFEYIFDATWLGFWIQKSLKNPKILIPRAIIKLILFGPIFHRFLLRSGGQVGPMLATFLGPRRPKRPPRRSQDASKTIPRAPQDPIQPGLATKTGVPYQPRGGIPSAQVVFWSIFG